MSAPRFYSWDDDGSPGRALTGNLQNKLKQILVPCLVTGYGDKPGAGWTLEHEHENGFTLSNGDAYVNFVSNLPAHPPYPAMPSYPIHIYVAESLTDTSKAIVDGLNLCSGPYRKDVPEGAGYPRHALGTGYCFSSALSTLQWTLIADEKTVVLSVSAADAGTRGDYYQFTLYFGNTKSDLGLENTFLVLGGSNSNYNSNNSVSQTLWDGFTSPRNLGTGLAEYSYTSSMPFQARGSVYPVAAFTGFVPSVIGLRSPRVYSAAGYVGELRGAAYDEILSLHGWRAYLRALGFSGDSFLDRGRVTSIGDYSYAYAVGYNGGFVMTDDPAYW